MISEEAAPLIIELAKDLIALVRNVEPRWTKAYYRFFSEEARYGPNGSYVVDSTAMLISALRNAEFYDCMNENGIKLLASFGKEKGVFLLITNDKFDYDIKFEWEDLKRWEITRNNGGTGIPVGL